MNLTKLSDFALPDIVTARALARVLDVTPAAARQMFRRGLIPGCKLGRRWVVTRHALLAHIASLSEPLWPQRLTDAAQESPIPLAAECPPVLHMGTRLT